MAVTIVKKQRPKLSVDVPAHVVKKAVLLGLVDDRSEVVDKIQELLWVAAPITHPNANKRYEDWLFTVRKGSVTSIHHIKCGVCEDRKRVVVFDECTTCYGAGCPKCNGSGDRKGMIPCPECAAK